MFKYFFVLLLLTGCNTESKKDADEPTSGNTGNAAAQKGNDNLPQLAGCYISASGLDSATLKLSVKDNAVTGELKYNRYQKDKNSGMLEGKVMDSLIIADYTFQSEGVVSVREVVFKINGSSLLEGFGDITMKADTARFRDKSRLSYHDDHPFVKTICQ